MEKSLPRHKSVYRELKIEYDLTLSKILAKAEEFLKLGATYKDIEVNVCTDYEDASISCFTPETDEEYEKRKALYLETEARLKENVKLAKEAAKKREYQTYLDLKKKYEKVKD